MRQHELSFLGIAPPVEKKESAIKIMKANALTLKNTQKSRINEYETRKNELMEELKARESTDIYNQKKEELDLLLSNYLNEFGAYPKDIKTLLERNNPDKLTDKEPEEEVKGKKGKEKKKEKEKKKAAKGKKGAEEEISDADKPKIYQGPSEIVGKYEDQIKLFTENWSSKDEANNFEQRHDDLLIKSELRPEIESEIEKAVEAQAELELKNRKILKGLKVKSKKSSKSKKGKKDKEEVPYDKWKPPKLPLRPLPGQKAIKDSDSRSLLQDLVNFEIATKTTPISMEEFIGTQNMIGSIVDVNNQKDPPNPSFAQIRELIIEHAIMPLGSKLVRQRVPEQVKSMLFFGQPGSGKTLMAKIIAYETSALVFDLSPGVIDNVCTDKKAEEKIVASVMRVAKDFQPSLIYIDECERFFPKKKKKKGAKGAKKTFGKVKKLLETYKKKFIKDNRILIIGCTDEVIDAKKDVKKFFDKFIFFPYPDHTNSRIIWEHMIKKCGGSISPDFQLSTLATISEGYTCGVIKQICESVITEHRKATV